MNRLIHSFRHAFRGLATAFSTQPNLRIHLLAGALAITLGFLLKIAPGEWLALILAIALVTAAELFNTALEFLADRLTSVHDPLIGKAKDLAAAAVLVTAVAAAAVAAIIFLPRLLRLLFP